LKNFAERDGLFANQSWTGRSYPRQKTKNEVYGEGEAGAGGFGVVSVGGGGRPAEQQFSPP